MTYVTMSRVEKEKNETYIPLFFESRDEHFILVDLLFQDSANTWETLT